MKSNEPNEGVVRRAELLNALDALQAVAHSLVLAIERKSAKAPMERSMDERSPTEAPPLNAAIEDTSIVPSADLLPLSAYPEVEVVAKLEWPTQEIVPKAGANNENRLQSEENIGFAERPVEFKDRRGVFGLDAPPLNSIEDTSIAPSADLLPRFAYAEMEGAANQKRPTQAIVPSAEMNNEDQPLSEENVGFAARLVEFKNRRGGFGPR